LFDEFDASNSVAVAALNMALANGICQFPDALVRKHKDFKVIAAGNTALRGATQEYNARNALDGASVNRFVFIEFGYDENMERALTTDDDWCAYVQAVRAAVADRPGLNLLVTPRATIDGAALIADAGASWEEAAHAAIWKGLDPDTVATLMDATAYAWKG
jgi:hypothetical protein